MTVHGAVRLVEHRLGVLRDLMRELRTAVSEDHPAATEVVVVPQLLTDAVDDELGWLDGAAGQAATAARAAARHDLQSVASALERCDALCAEAARRLVTGLAGLSSHLVLRQLATDRPGPWRRWATDVEAAIVGLWTPLWAAQDAIRDCRQEIVEQLLAAQPAHSDAQNALTARHR